MGGAGGHTPHLMGHSRPAAVPHRRRAQAGGSGAPVHTS
eukprot:gene3061-1469_t